MSARDTESLEELVAGPERAPGTRQLRQPVILAGLGACVLFVCALLWFIATHLGAMASAAPTLPASQAPGVISSAAPARVEDIAGAPLRSNALPSPSPAATPDPAATLPPGDLNGAPITAAQTVPAIPPGTTANAAAADGAAGAAAPTTPSPAQIAAEAAAQRRQAALDEERAAMQAPLTVQLSHEGDGDRGTAAATPQKPPTPMPSPVGSEAYDVPPASKYVVKRGMIIPATINTSITSTVDGTIIAYTAADVYDFTHQVLVWPRGSKLIGSFGGTAIVPGQTRIPVAFDSLQLTNGHTIALGNMPGADLTGTSGLGATVDNHTRAIFSHVVLLSLLSAGAQLAQPRTSGCSGIGGCAPSVGQTIGQAVGQTIAQTGTTLLARDENVTPTLHVVEGAQIAVMVQTDIPVTPWAP